MKINILLCYEDNDGNYARHCAVTMLSILETNKQNRIKFYIMSSFLSKQNKKEFLRIVNLYHQEIEFIIHNNIIPKEISPFLIDHLGLGKGMFYRLFFHLYIKNIDRILYLDCDTIVMKDLSRFYNIDLEGKTIAGYYENDLVVNTAKKTIHTSNYINSGVLLLDVKRYKKHSFGLERIKEINNKFGKYIYSDQDYININFKSDILIYKKGINYLLTRPFYNKGLDDATILHCLSKPYLKYSLCPKKIINLYYQYLNRTKWKNFPKKENSFCKYCYDLFCNFIYILIGKRMGLIAGKLRLTEKIYSFFNLNKK